MKAMMRGLTRATSSISLRGGKSSTPTQKVFVGSSENSKSAEPDEDSDPGVAATRAASPPVEETKAESAPIREARQPAGPSSAWANAGNSGNTDQASGIVERTVKPFETTYKKAETAEVSEPAPKPAPKPALKKTVTLESDSDLEDEEIPEAPKPKPAVAFREDVIAGYNQRAQDRERWLADISQGGQEDGAPSAASPTTVQATTRINRAPMEWEQKPLAPDLPGAVGYDQTVMPLKELRRARGSQQGYAQQDSRSPAAAAAPALGPGGFMPLRDADEVFNEQLKKFNMHMRAGSQKSDADPWQTEGPSRISWTFSVH